MSEERTDTEPGRLVSCRACGNRVARSARRCPGCGVRDPLSAESGPARPRPNAGRSLAAWTRLPAVLIALAAVAVGALVLLVVVLASARREPPPVAAVAPPAPVEVQPPAPAPVAVLPSPPPPEPSRSRGRPDWPFFFSPGDRLARMGDAKPLGYIMRVVKNHRFPDGTQGPAYILWTPAGDEQAFDADELERSAKME